MSVIERTPAEMRAMALRHQLDNLKDDPLWNEVQTMLVAAEKQAREKMQLSLRPPANDAAQASYFAGQVDAARSIITHLESQLQTSLRRIEREAEIERTSRIEDGGNPSGEGQGTAERGREPDSANGQRGSVESVPGLRRQRKKKSVARMPIVSGIGSD